MFLAEITQNAHAFYQEWGLIGAVIAPLIAAAGGCLWKLRKHSLDTIEDAYLDIKSALAGRFQEIILQEALELFEEVDKRLPTVLAQADPDTSSKQSRFDELCVELRNLDPDNPDRRLFSTIVRGALGTVISAEVRDIISSVSPRKAFLLRNTSQSARIEFSLDGETEERLTELASETVSSRNRRNLFVTSQKWGQIFCIAGLVHSGMNHAGWRFLPIGVDRTLWQGGHHEEVCRRVDK